MTQPTSAPPHGTATIAASAATMHTALVVDGPCLTETLARLEEGHGADPMPRPALEKARQQAIAFLEKVIRAYQENVAAGEVGAGGSARASKAAPLAGKGKCPTGLLYGRIQSGKTLGMITSTALAMDNGFRIVVVLTSNYVKLVEQTAERFAALANVNVLDSNSIMTWNADADHIRSELCDQGLVLVCAKDPQHLTTLVSFLETVDAAAYPAIVLDDEADQATPDTTTNARAAQKPSAPDKSSAIFRKTVKNDDSSEIGESVREKLRHNVFLQVTATPYALLLQNSDNPLRPKFTHLLEPGDGYTGGESFFAEEHVDEERPPLCFVDEDEASHLDQADTAPIGLQQAVAFFLVSASVHYIRGVRGQQQNFLCHTSAKTADHERVANLVRNFLADVLEDLKRPTFGGQTAARLVWARDELAKTLPDAPQLEEICVVLRKRLPLRKVPIVNSASSNVEFRREMNFIVGGNILGRGLTIKNLLVTYYMRRAKVSQMDTMLQHARMFGYRRALMPYTRVFVPESLAVRFHRIHTAEQALRARVADPRFKRIPVQTSPGLRATRTNVLDTGSLAAYAPGDHIYPNRMLADAKKQERFGPVVRDLLGGAFTEHKEDNLLEVSIDDAIRLVEAFPYDEDEPGNWDSAAIKNVLVSIAERYARRAFVFVRRMGEKRAKTSFATGAVSGDELRLLRTKRGPVVCVFRDDSKQSAKAGSKQIAKAAGVEYWYPSVILPDDEEMPTHVFNTTT